VKLSRVQATLLIGSLSVVFIFVGNFVLDMVSSINAFATLIVLCTSPWMVIMMIGFVLRRGFYDPDDLQVFNQGLKGGRYWFTRGVNWRAMAAWIPATTLGLLTANTPMIAGPFKDIAGGVDISMVVTLCTAAIAYPLLVKLFPEPREVYGTEAAGFAPGPRPERQPQSAA